MQFVVKWNKEKCRKGDKGTRERVILFLFLFKMKGILTCV